MITNLLEVVREWVSGKFEDFLNSLKNEFGLIKTYDIMPSDEVLAAMPNQTIFRTKGYYSKLDGNGGLYMVDLGSGFGRLISGTSGANAKFLVALDENANFYVDKSVSYTDDNGQTQNINLRNMELINVCRYGIRSCTLAVTSKYCTVENTHAAENSAIMSTLISSNPHQKNFYFPQGRFYFENPINLAAGGGGSQNSITGAFMPPVLNRVTSGTDRTYNSGSALCFPWLADGQAAINLASGNIENVQIIGNPAIYTIVFNRANLKTDPSTVMVETISESEDHQPIKCTGIYRGGAIGVIRNVNVAYFYEAAHVGGSNTYVQNLYITRCHLGLLMGTDVQASGVYGWSVHTLVRVVGGSCVGSIFRVDSCHHVVNIVTGSGIKLSDINGDFCTGNMITIGNEETNITAVSVNALSIVGLQGRCCALKSYYNGSGEVTNGNPKYTGINNLDIGAWEHYGVIRVLKSGTLINSFFLMNGLGGGNILDTKDDPNLEWFTPECIYTFHGQAKSIQNNTFFITKGFIGTKDSVKRITPLWYDRCNTIMSSYGTFFLKNTKRIVATTDEDDSIITVDTMPNSYDLPNTSVFYKGESTSDYKKGSIYVSTPHVTTPTSGVQPIKKHWFTYNGTVYVPTGDWSVVSGRTYYEFTWDESTLSNEQTVSKVDSLPTASPSELTKMHIYGGVTDSNAELYHGATYECIAEEVTPVETDNPSVKGWYELDNDTYTLTTDISLVTGKTYYKIYWNQLTVVKSQQML